MEIGMERVRRSLIMVLSVSAILFGCGKVERSSEASGKASPVTVAGEPAYTVTQQDAYHTGSRAESARKNRITMLGSYPGTLPEATPTIDAAAAAINNHSVSQLKVSLFEHGVLRKTSFPFDYENDIAALKSLHAMHKLDTVVKGGTTDLERLIALARYTNEFLAGGSVPEGTTPSGPSALDITRNRLERGIGGGSQVHAALFCQLALSCGYTGRLVGMHSLDASGQPLSNMICEVYLTVLDKWVAFDPFNRAAYYRRGASPLSALELHQAAAEDRLREISPVTGLGDLNDVAQFRANVLPRFRYIYLYRMNDILGRSPRGGSIPWDALYQAHLVWEDRNTLVSAGEFGKLAEFKDGVKYVTHTRNDFEWNLNLVNITLVRSDDKTVTIHLDTITPNFSAFKIRSGQKGLKSGNVFPVGEPFDPVTIDVVDAFGQTGPTAQVQFMR